jgi:hypothetical protein
VAKAAALCARETASGEAPSERARALAANTDELDDYVRTWSRDARASERALDGAPAVDGRLVLGLRAIFEGGGDRPRARARDPARPARDGRRDRATHGRAERSAHDARAGPTHARAPGLAAERGPAVGTELAAEPCVGARGQDRLPSHAAGGEHARAEHTAHAGRVSPHAADRAAVRALARGADADLAARADREAGARVPEPAIAPEPLPDSAASTRPFPDPATTRRPAEGESYPTPKRGG